MTEESCECGIAIAVLETCGAMKRIYVRVFRIRKRSFLRTTGVWIRRRLSSLCEGRTLCNPRRRRRVRQKLDIRVLRRTDAPETCGLKISQQMPLARSIALDCAQ